MEKPTSVRRMEFINKLAALINESKLPAFVLEPIIKETHSIIKNQMNEQYVTELKHYEEQIAQNGAR